MVFEFNNLNLCSIKWLKKIYYTYSISGYKKTNNTFQDTLYDI